mgnify:CR=1 FL=1
MKNKTVNKIIACCLLLFAFIVQTACSDMEKEYAVSYTHLTLPTKA